MKIGQINGTSPGWTTMLDASNRILPQREGAGEQNTAAISRLLLDKVQQRVHFGRVGGLAPDSPVAMLAFPGPLN